MNRMASQQASHTAPPVGRSASAAQTTHGGGENGGQQAIDARRAPVSTAPRRLRAASPTVRSLSARRAGGLEQGAHIDALALPQSRSSP